MSLLKTWIRGTIVQGISRCHRLNVVWLILTTLLWRQMTTRSNWRSCELWKLQTATRQRLKDRDFPSRHTSFDAFLWVQLRKWCWPTRTLLNENNHSSDHFIQVLLLLSLPTLPAYESCSKLQQPCHKYAVRKAMSPQCFFTEINVTVGAGVSRCRFRHGVSNPEPCSSQFRH